MYHAIVRGKLRESFAQINKGNYAAIVKQFAPNAEHWFPGEHALSGKRTTHESIEQWYARLAVVMPDLRFELTKVSVKGWPWNTVAFVEWVDHLSDREGRHYSNQGVHALKLSWGKITELHIYCDTKLLGDVLAILGEQGVAEAVAPPIDSTAPVAV